ncbi:MBL fold metallo-hydrolase [Eubacteriaceae bacterium ES3]|nr:MBL fold metallo-hydrolase [Eubacteriaceae bacterium ES3]
MCLKEKSLNERIIFLGTGNAAVTECYNTCFAIEKENEYFLVDTGGGNGILRQLKHADIPLNAIHEIFISHGHTDHLLGVIWLIRMIGAQILNGKYNGKLKIYTHPKLIRTIKKIVKLTVQKQIVKLLDDKICFRKIKDGQTRKIMAYPVTFFDIKSKKERQFGFVIKLMNGKKLAFLGDEPFYRHEKKYVNKADWLLHEAFCLYEEREIFLPYDKSHVTVKEACENAVDLNIKNLVLYHTEDKNIIMRKYLYFLEAKKFFSGNILIPDDLEIFEL